MCGCVKFFCMVFIYFCLCYVLVTIWQVIRGVDVDGDKCIDLQEVEISMRETEQMGTIGSAWR